MKVSNHFIDICMSIRCYFALTNIYGAIIINKFHEIKKSIIWANSFILFHFLHFFHVCAPWYEFSTSLHIHDSCATITITSVLVIIILSLLILLLLFTHSYSHCCQLKSINRFIDLPKSFYRRVKNGNTMSVHLFNKKLFYFWHRIVKS